MDVILDSNQYIADFALASNRFSNLFDYLRRTRSTLVVPKLVLDEVVARHRDELKARAQKAEHHWNTLQQCVVSGKLGDFPKIDFAGESKALRALLKKPSTRVKTKDDDDLSGVELEDVLQRGINRKRPASNKGEELRDVVLWFVVLHYAKKVGEEIAFVAKDTTFIEGGAVHPDISADIASRGVTVHMYSSIDDFIKAQAPQPAVVTPDWLKRFEPKNLSIIMEQHTIPAFRRVPSYNSYSITHATCDNLKFVEGSLYSVGRNSTYAELMYRPVLTVEAEGYGTTNTITYTYEPSTYENLITYSNIFQPNPMISGEVPTGLAALVSPGPVDINIGGFPSSFVNVLGSPVSLEPMTVNRKTFRVEAICNLSIRVVAEKVSPIEIHRFDITAVHDISTVAVK